MDTERIIGELLHERKEQKKRTGALMAIGVGILTILIIGFLLVVPRTFILLGHVDGIMNDIEATSQSIRTLVNGNSKTLTDTVSGLSGIDFDGLNQAITDLKDTVAPLANLIRSFR